MRTRLRCRATALLIAVLGAAGCAPSPLLSYRADQPPTATLPIALAGIRDAREPFGALFAAELRSDGADRGLSWLHATSNATANAAAAERAAGVRSTFEQRAGSTAVLVVAGLFGDCLGAHAVPFGDGVERDGAASLDEGYRQYRDLGLHSIHFVTVPGRASSAANGRLLADVIRSKARQPGVRRLVLFGYSKGVPDLQEALARLQRDGGIPSAVVALVSVAGAVLGTPLADYYEAAYDALSPLANPFDCSPAQGGDMASLTRRDRLAWLAANPLPNGLATYSIVAHAPVDEMAPLLRVAARQLAAVDPRNDGQLLASDALLPGSTLLAEALADHWDVALPRDRHAQPVLSALMRGRGFPREALFRATLRWVVSDVR